MDAQESKYCWDGLMEHVPMLRRELGRRSKDPSEVDDLLQESLMRAARFRHKLRDERSLRGWLRKLARRVSSEHLRRVGRRTVEQATLEFFESLPGREHEPGTRALNEGVVIYGKLVFRHQLMEDLHWAVGQLRPSDRALIAQRYGLELIADPPARPASLKDHMFRARQRLRKRLRKRLPRLVELGAAETFVEENR